MGRAESFCFPNSERGQGATFLGVIGAGVPPFMGALPLVALWGALKALSFPFSVFRSPFSVFRSQLSAYSNKNANISGIFV